MSKKEQIKASDAAARKKEDSIKKLKNRDFRKWANKYMAPGTLPMKVSGLGEGTVNYCPKCDLKCTKSYNKDFKWYCKVCDTEAITMTKNEFNLFREAQENDKNTDKLD